MLDKTKWPIQQTITMTLTNEDVYDYDELMCMYEQFIAIHLGLADPIKCFASDSVQIKEWKLEDPKVFTTTTGCCSNKEMESGL